TALIVRLFEPYKQRRTVKANERPAKQAHIDAEPVSPFRPAADDTKRFDERRDERQAVDAQTADKQPLADKQMTDKLLRTDEPKNGQPADIASRLIDAKRTHRQRRL
ncbi:MAG: hypothetical protein PWP55_1111, partial [Clostridiales bacterium]|nr:hypothetical protein [Clostridiales bacterium]